MAADRRAESHRRGERWSDHPGDARRLAHRRIPADEVWSKLGLAVTIPGTSTADLAILGIPFILMLPTAWGDTAPLPASRPPEGLPLIGRYLKRALAHLILRQFKFLAHPNRRADRMIAPEIVGRFSAGDLASAVLELIRSDRRRMSLALQEAMGEPGATIGLSPNFDLPHRTPVR